MSIPAITQITGEFTPGEIDPLLSAIRQSIVCAGKPAEKPADWTATAWAVLKEFGEKQVTITNADDSDADIDSVIKAAVGKTGGLCLLLVSGSGKNPDPAAPGPLVNLALDAQLYTSKRIRGSRATPPLVLMTAVARFLHLSKIRTDGFEAYEKIKFLGFDQEPDPEFCRHDLHFERELML